MKFTSQQVHQDSVDPELWPATVNAPSNEPVATTPPDPSAAMPVIRTELAPASSGTDHRWLPFLS